MERMFYIVEIDGQDDFQGEPLGTKPHLKENVLIFIRDGNAAFDYEKVKKATDKWTIIVVSNLSDAKKMIKDDYSYDEKSISHLVIKSHGHVFDGADLDSRSGVGVVHKFSDNKNSSEIFIRKLLKDDATVVFTACSIIQFFDKVPEDTRFKKEENNQHHKSAKETVNNYYSFWIKSTKRNLFIDYTSTHSWNFSNVDKSKDEKGVGTFTDGDKYWFLFDSNFIIPGKPGQYFAGFVWFTEGVNKYAYKPDFYQMQVNSSGGITVHPVKNIATSNMLPAEEKKKKKL